MSCQQLIQEDPYVFTDTISNTANFMHENNSQTKYVPLNRQTIYNRQFRQHEPTITLATDTSGGATLIAKSATLVEQQKQKIVINPSSLKEKKNGYNNGKILTTANISNTLILPSSPKTSPKFFKSHPQQNGKHILVSSSNCNSSVINHSIASVSKIQSQNQQFQQNTSNKTIIQLNHVAELQSLPTPPITGIKEEKSNDDNYLNVTLSVTTAAIAANASCKNVKAEEKSKIKREDENFDDKKVCHYQHMNVKKNKRTKKRKEKLSLKKSALVNSRVRSTNVIVEPVSISIPRNAPQVQAESNVIGNGKKLVPQKSYRYDDTDSKHLTRDERLKMRKIHFRHILNQYRANGGAGILKGERINQMQQKSTEQFRIQFDKTCQLLKMLDRTKEKIFKKSIIRCNIRDCFDEAILSSDYCSKHILSTDKEQFLIRQCCFLYSDGHQCRVPVSDIMASVAVCREHTNAPSYQLISNNSSNIIDSTKPKKPPVQRKQRTKTTLIRPAKKCIGGAGSGNGKLGGRKKKTDLLVPVHRPTMIIHPNDLHKLPQQQSAKNTIKKSLTSSSASSSPSLLISTAMSAGTSIAATNLPLKQDNLQVENNHQFIHQNSGFLLASSQSSYGSISSGNEDLYLKQDLMTRVCENSYESSEDTGVGGLSENELISHDVISNFDMESCAELSKVLSSLPSNTLDDLLTEPLHTSRDDEEYLDRAIEEVSATGMDQIAITAFEHLEGLDMLEMLDDDEQRQMISAATNLISMSGYISSGHDQDNYSAMPSPMMS